MRFVEIQALVSLCLAIFGSAGLYTAIIMSLVDYFADLDLVLFRILGIGVFLTLLIAGLIYYIPKVRHMP